MTTKAKQPDDTTTADPADLFALDGDGRWLLAVEGWAPERELPGTDEAARSHLALPMGTGLTRDDVEEVVRACASGST